MYQLSEESIEYLKKDVNMGPVMKEKIEHHMKRFGIDSKVCAYYSDWEDFCSDWCDGIGYTRTQARHLLHNGTGEFMILPENAGIIRFSM